jgi:hypothetical protein
MLSDSVLSQTKQAEIDEGQTTQWPIEKRQKDKQRSTKHTPKTKDPKHEPH